MRTALITGASSVLGREFPGQPAPEKDIEQFMVIGHRLQQTPGPCKNRTSFSTDSRS